MHARCLYMSERESVWIHVLILGFQISFFRTMLSNKKMWNFAEVVKNLWRFERLLNQLPSKLLDSFTGACILMIFKYSSERIQLRWLRTFLIQRSWILLECYHSTIMVECSFFWISWITRCYLKLLYFLFLAIGWP